MTARRGHGEGSLFFDESRNRWVGTVDLGRDGAGKRRRVKITGRTRTEARAKLKALRDNADSGLPTGDQRVTVGEWLDQWVAALPIKSANTRDNLDWAIRLHLKPALGAYRLRDLTPEHVETMLLDSAAANLSRSSLARLHNVLSRALRSAERRGKIARNVATLVDVPPGPVRTSRSLTVDQAKALLRAATGDWLEALYVTGLMLGLRPGELLGLSWDGVDFERGVLKITQSLIREHGADLRIGELKTRSSRRVLTMPTPVADSLRAHRTKQTAERLACPCWHDTGLVFTTEIGTPVDPSNLRRGLRRLTKAAGLGHWHPHELRHSAVSILSASGVPMEVIADVVGHSSQRTTAVVYRHMIEPTVRAAAEPMERLFGKPS